jgi:hypothetical protein
VCLHIPLSAGPALLYTIIESPSGNASGPDFTLVVGCSQSSLGATECSGAAAVLLREYKFNPTVESLDGPWDNYSALHFILQSQFSKNLPFSWVLVPIRLLSIDVSFVRYLVWNNTCENGVF